MVGHDVLPSTPISQSCCTSPQPNRKSPSRTKADYDRSQSLRVTDRFQVIDELFTLRKHQVLKRSPALTGLPSADALPKNRFPDESLSPRGAKVYSSSDTYTSKQATPIRALPSLYRNKTISRKTRTSLPKPSMTDQSRTEGNSPKDGPRLVLQPETGPISQEQLVAEVKGIYAGLVMVEAKCVEIDSKLLAPERDPRIQQARLDNEQWQALIALHRTLLHEHHDFFLASQHPSASPALRRLAAKYTMPARMWRHGIHSFLELLRHRLPDSLDHMLTFIYLAYSMMALLYETVSTFQDTWIECLGDLGRYRLAIEEEDFRDQDIRSRIAPFWYSKAPVLSSEISRLYHYLAIRAWLFIIQERTTYLRARTEGVLCQKQPESDMSRGWCLKDEDIPRQRIHDTCSATTRKLQLSLSVSKQTLLQYGYYFGMTALCTGLALPLRWLLVVKSTYFALLCFAVCHATARIPAMATKDAVTVVDKTTLRRTGDPYTAAKRCAPGDKKTVQKLRQLRELESVIGHGTNTVDALKTAVDIPFSPGVAGTEVARELRVLGWLGCRLRGIITGAYTLLNSPSLSARFIRPRRTCGIAVWLLSMRPVLAVAFVPEDLSAVDLILNPTTGPLTTVNPVRTDPNGPAPSEWSFPILCVMILVICWSFARLKGWEPSNVVGTLAAIYWYLWLYLIRYPDISQWYPWS